MFEHFYDASHHTPQLARTSKMALKEKIELAERILKLAELARKLETQVYSFLYLCVFSYSCGLLCELIRAIYLYVAREGSAVL